MFYYYLILLSSLLSTAYLIFSSDTSLCRLIVESFFSAFSSLINCNSCSSTSPEIPSKRCNADDFVDVKDAYFTFCFTAYHF